jgi:GTPase SAR1 family protein
MKAFEALRDKIKSIEESSSKWGIAFIGPNGYGKTVVIKNLIENMTSNKLKFVRLDLLAPPICPEPRVHVNWGEYVKQVMDLLQTIDFSEVNKINSELNKMSKMATICSENNTRVFIVLDHFEFCKNWREARWPIENEIGDVIVVCDEDAWNEKKTDRVVTSFFFKRVYLDKPVDFEKDKEIFCEIISEKLGLEKPKIREFLEKISKECSQGKIYSWNDILRMIDEM